MGSSVKSHNPVAKSHFQDVLDEAAKKTGAVGAQVSIIRDGIQSDFTFGSANVELDSLMRIDTIVQVGSVTKLINAALVMALIDEGKLSADLPISNYISTITLSNFDAQERITIRQLLSMSSGLDNGPYVEHGSGTDALAKYIDSLREIPLVFEPGTGFGYSNAGISLAGRIAEVVTGKSWDDLVSERIFEPAGLLHSVTKPESLPFQRVAVGHVPIENGRAVKVVRPWYITRAQGPAGSTLAMSAQDLASFGALFVNGGKSPSGRIVLSEAAVSSMLTPTTVVPIPIPAISVGKSWGLGPSVNQWGNRAIWGHAGGNRSGTSTLLWSGENRAVLAFTVNTCLPFDFETFSEKILAGIGGEVFEGEPPKLPTPSGTRLVINPGRFVGGYASYGTQYEITEKDGGLWIKKTNLGRGVVGETLGVAANCALLPVGEDKFLLEISGLLRETALAFFGSDSTGRATTLVDTVFAARRTD